MQNTVRYMQILAYFTDIIDAGKMQEGDQMPTENEICTLFNVSRTTVRMALNALCQNGYIYKIQGKGSFVAHKETDMQLTICMVSVTRCVDWGVCLPRSSSASRFLYRVTGLPMR